MEIRVLRYFLNVVREESITKAADVLHITQPTLSRQLSQMEDDIGVKLFHRGTRKITLTNEGMLLRRRAEEILQLVDNTEKELVEQEEQIEGKITIGCGELASVQILAELTRNFSTKHPGVSYDIFTATADLVKEQMDKGLIDIGLLLEPVEISRYHFVRMPLEEKWQVLMRKDCPLAEKERICPSDLAELPLIIARRQSVRNLLENWFGNVAERVRIASTCNLSHINQSIMVESGIGAALVMDFSCDDQTLCLKPLEPELVSGCVLVWKKNHVLPPALTRFIDYMKTSLALPTEGRRERI